MHFTHATISYHLISIDNPYLHGITNHPVHLKDNMDNPNPSALIPFCGFGGDMLIMGEAFDNMEFPVCNKFRPRVLSGQLCYSVDVNEFKDQIEPENLKNGLIMLIDRNPGRTLTSSSAKVEMNNQNSTDVFEVLKVKKNYLDFTIHIDTIGRNNLIFQAIKKSQITLLKKLETLIIPQFLCQETIKEDQFLGIKLTFLANRRFFLISTFIII